MYWSWVWVWVHCHFWQLSNLFLLLLSYCLFSSLLLESNREVASKCYNSYAIYAATLIESTVQFLCNICLAMLIESRLDRRSKLLWVVTISCFVNKILHHTRGHATKQIHHSRNANSLTSELWQSAALSLRLRANLRGHTMKQGSPQQEGQQFDIWASLQMSFCDSVSMCIKLECVTFIHESYSCPCFSELCLASKASTAHRFVWSARFKVRSSHAVSSVTEIRVS